MSFFLSVLSRPRRSFLAIFASRKLYTASRVVQRGYQVAGAPEENEGDGLVSRKGFVVSCRRTPHLVIMWPARATLVKSNGETIFYWRKAIAKQCGTLPG